MNSKWETEKENLEYLILVEKKSYEEIGRIYNCSGANIKKVSLRLGINLQPRRQVNECETFNRGIIKVPISNCLNCGQEYRRYDGHRGKFCSSECCNEYHKKIKYEEYLKNPEQYIGNDMKWVKKHILKEQDNKCSICGCEPVWNEKPLVFILDHIDGHANNNKRENLRLVCPNCDSQLDTYKSKNKHSDRTYFKVNQRKLNKSLDGCKPTPIDNCPNNE